MNVAAESAGLGTWVKQKRLAAGLSLRELADLAGIAHSSLDKAERGGGMRDSTLELVVCALAGENATEDELAALLREAKIAKAGLLPELEREPDPDVEYLVGSYHGMTPRNKKIVMTLIEQLREDDKELSIGGTGEPRRRGDAVTADTPEAD